MDEFLTSDRDRELFGLEPVEESGVEEGSEGAG